MEHPLATDPASLVMSYPDIFTSGTEDLQDLINFPDAEIFWSLHERHHVCRSGCSGVIVYNILRFGWSPTFIDTPDVHRGGVYNNNNSEKSIQKELDSLLLDGKISKVRLGSLRCVLPIKIVLKADHIEHASLLLHLSPAVVERMGADVINDRLMALGHDPIKTRLVTDFRVGCFNDTLDDYPFAYSTIHSAVGLSYEKMHPVYSKIDFKQYFLQIPLAEKCRDLFGFVVRDQAYMFNALPFGVKSAPIVASLVSAELVQLAANLFGITAISYIDDILIVSEGWKNAHADKENFLKMLEQLRFQVNFDKVYGPSESMEYLGYVLNASSTPITISFNSDKFRVAKRKTFEALQLRKLSYSALASLAGTLLYMSEIISLGWSHSLGLWSAGKGLSDKRRAFKIHLDDCQITYLEWWLKKLTFKERDALPVVHTQPTPAVQDLVRATKIFSDASLTKGFGFFSEDESIVESHEWPAELLTVLDMLTKELFPFVVFMEQYGELFANNIIIWCTDNAAAAMTLNGGAARNAEPNELIMRILNVSERWNITVLTIWIPRHLNIFADYLSKASNMF